MGVPGQGEGGAASKGGGAWWWRPPLALNPGGGLSSSTQSGLNHLWPKSPIAGDALLGWREREKKTSTIPKYEIPTILTFRCLHHLFSKELRVMCIVPPSFWPHNSPAREARLREHDWLKVSQETRWQNLDLRGVSLPPQSFRLLACCARSCQNASSEPTPAPGESSREGSLLIRARAGLLF